MRQLFFCRKNKKKYLIVDEDIQCDVCKKPIDLMDIVVIHTKGSKKRGISKAYTCLDDKCLKKYRLEEIDIWTHAFIVENLPLDCEAILETNPEIGWGGRASATTVAISNDGINSDTSNIKVIDHTRLAGRPEGSWQGVSIGKDITKELEEKDKPLLEDDPLNLLKDLQQGTQRAIDMGLNPEVRANELIEQKKAKAVEDKSDDIKNP